MENPGGAWNTLLNPPFLFIYIYYLLLLSNANASRGILVIGKYFCYLPHVNMSPPHI